MAKMNMTNVEFERLGTILVKMDELRLAVANFPGAKDLLLERACFLVEELSDLCRDVNARRMGDPRELIS